MEQEDLPKIEIYNSKRKLFLMLAMSAIFLIVSILAFINLSGYKKVLLFFSLLFFSISFLVVIIQLFKSRNPIIILDGNGIMYNIVLRNKNIFVKWNEIKEIHFSKTFIYIYLKEESSLSRNRKNANEPFVFYMSELKMKKNTVISLITHYFEKSTGII